MAEGPSKNGSQVSDDPDYRAAVEKESQARAEAFVPGLRKFICGIEVLPLTFAHVTLLRGIGSPFVSVLSEPPNRAQVVQFLWCVSPHYAAAQSLRDLLDAWFPRLAVWLFDRAQRRFISKAIRIPYALALVEINEYMDQAFADSPGGTGRAGFFVKYFSGEASLVMLIAKHTGWSKRDILSEPVECLWQYFRIIKKESDPGASFLNPSDKIRAEVLAKLKARAANSE